MIQTIALMLVLIIVVLVFMRNKESLSLTKMSYTGILLAIALVLNYFSINLMIFGGQLVIRFSQLILILIGAMLGPVYAVFGGIGFDMLSLFLNPLGSFYAGFMLNNILVGLIPAILFKYFRKSKLVTNISLLSVSSIMYLLYIIIVSLISFTSVVTQDVIETSMFVKFITVFIITIILIMILLVYIKRSNVNVDNRLLLLIITLVLVEFFIQGFLTPLWLNDMMQTPIIISMQLRSIKGIFMILINSVVGYPILRMLDKSFK